MRAATRAGGDPPPKSVAAGRYSMTAPPVSPRARLRIRAAAWFRLLHPFPSLLNAITAGALACIAVRGWPGGARLLSLMATMLLIQFTIGAANDWADRDLDRSARPEKPVAAGLVSPRLALMLALILGGAAVALASRDGPAAWSLAALGLAIGLAYDLGLKRTPFSALTYALALPLLPIWVWTALDRTTPALAALLPVGALLGLSLQLANALPDARGDTAAGVRGTLQWLGPARGRAVAWGAFGLALALAALLAGVLHLRALPFVPLWLLSAALLAATVSLYQRGRNERALRLGWSLLAPAAGLLAVGWLGSLP